MKYFVTISNDEKRNMMFALISKCLHANGYDLISITIQHAHQNIWVLTFNLANR